MTREDEVNDFEGEAVERLEAFIEPMIGDKRFTIPVAEFDGPVEDNWSHIFTSRASRLITRMQDRLSKLAEKKFGFDAAFEMDLSTHMYQEE